MNEHKEPETKQMETTQLYRNKLVKIPTPRFLVFYNGLEEQPQQQILKLSDSFFQPMEQPELELIVTMININPTKNPQLLEKCRLLKEYMQYIEKVRSYTPCMDLPKAVEQAVQECIQEGILKNFLEKYRKEAIAVSIFEYNETLALSYIREDEYEKGWTDVEANKLIKMVCKKMQKGKSVPTIAEELEEEVSTIHRIYQAAQLCEEQYDSKKIYEILKKDEIHR